MVKYHLNSDRNHWYHSLLTRKEFEMSQSKIRCFIALVLFAILGACALYGIPHATKKSWAKVEAEEVARLLSLGGYDDPAVLKRLDHVIDELSKYEFNLLDQRDDRVTQTLAELYARRATEFEVENNLPKALQDVQSSAMYWRHLGDPHRMLSLLCYEVELTERTGNPGQALILCETLIRQFPASYRPYALYVQLGRKHPEIIDQEKMKLSASKAKELSHGDWDIESRFIF